MPLQINAPDLSGLNVRSSGGLNIAPTGALGLQAIQTASSVSSARRQAELEQARLQQQAMIANQQAALRQQEMARQSSIANQQAILERQRMAQQGNQFAQGQALDAAKLAQTDRLDERKIGVMEQQMAAEAQQKEMAKLIDMDKQVLNKRGAFASYGLMSLKGAKTPEEAQQIKTEILKEAVAEGHISKEEAAQI